MICQVTFPCQCHLPILTDKDCCYWCFCRSSLCNPPTPDQQCVL